MEVHVARGMRDFLPDAMSRRLAVVDRIRTVFARHGFDPLDTPAMERIETLTGKYGEEGGKLMFKVLKRGDEERSGECDHALRYDLTVPLARVVAMNPSLPMPFKRWQIAPVWRAERPARGRFREFYQCDADIVGSTEPLAEAECLAVAADALAILGFEGYTVKLNDRRLLRAVATAVGAADRETELLVTLDKLDKVGREGVEKELSERGFPGSVATALWTLVTAATPDAARQALAGQPQVDEAARTMEDVIALAVALGVPEGRVVLDLTLARGLDYYTGPVFEVVLPEGNVGTVAAGGRYDQLIGIFGKQPIPAVGISLGLERLLVVLEERGRLGDRSDRPDVLVAVFDDAGRAAAARTAAALRQRGIRTDLWVGAPKLKHAFRHADARGARFVALVGPAEAAAGTVSVKHLASGEQRAVSLDDAIAWIGAPT